MNHILIKPTTAFAKRSSEIHRIMIKNIVELETIGTVLVNTVVLHIAVHSVTENIEYLTKLL